MGRAHDELEAFAVELATFLEVDHQYYEDVDQRDHDRIALVRAAGRRAARILGWKVRTLVVDLDSGMVRVFVVIIESNAEEHARLSERSRLLLEQAFREEGGA